MFPIILIMPDINKIFISDGSLYLHESASDKVYTYSFSDIENVDISLSKAEDREIKCLMEFRDMKFLFPINITINYRDFLEILDYSCIVNFKEFLFYLERNTDKHILSNSVSEWIRFSKPIPKEDQYPDNNEFRLSVAKLALMTMDRRLNRRLYKSRVEVFLYISFGMLFVILGFIMGYNQYIKDRFPFLFAFCIIGAGLIIFSFIPKKPRQY